MANSKSQYEIAMVIGGKMQSSFGSSINTANKGLTSIGDAAKTAAKIAAAAFTTMKIADVIMDSSKAAIEFQSSMSGVAKVVDGLKDNNGALTSSYYEMHDAILDLSKVIPMTADQIAEITAAAGQSNIPKEDLIEFTETASKMGIAFDSTAEQAGEWMAAWRTALSLNQEEVTSLADKINYLGNTSSENAIKLSEVVTTVGSLAQTAGLSGEGVAAIAAAMTKVDSAVAATGIKNMVTALTAGESATKSQRVALKALNLDAVDLANTMQVNAQGAILSVLEAIQRLPEAEQAAVLRNYFGKESLSSIAPLLANLDNLRTQFNKVGDASLYAGSMEKEYQSVSATTANDLQLAQNKIEAAKITLGENLLPLIGYGADLVGDFSESFADFASENAPKFNEAIQNIQAYIEKITPAVVKGFYDVSDAFRELWYFLSPVAEWVIQNPGTIVKFIVGIAVAIKTYQIVNGLMNMSKGLGALSTILTNPWAIAIGAVAAAFAVIAVNIATTNKRLKEASLESHFGDISMSIADCEDVARRMIKNKYFEQIDNMLAEFGKSDTYIESMQDAVGEMNRMNWKVSVGLELTEEELTSYQAAIDNYIKSAQSYVSQEGYNVEIAVKLLLGDSAGGEAGKNTLAYYQSYYSGLYDQIDLLSKDLSDYFTEAVKDGLTIDEVQVITNLQNQIADITNSLSKSELNANLQMLDYKYSGSDLTPETAIQINEELGKYINNAEAGYDEALSKALIAPDYQLKNGEITQAEYDQIVKPLYEGYTSQMQDAAMQAYDFLANTLYDTYGDELKNFSELGDADKDAIRQVVESFQSIEDALSQVAGMSYENTGKIPSEIQKSLENIGLLQQSLGSGNLFGLFDFRSETTKNIEYLAGKQVEGLYSSIENSLKEPINSDLNINLMLKYHLNSSPELFNKYSLDFPKNPTLLGMLKNGMKIQSNARGNIVTDPILTTFAEENPEAAIPIDGSQRSIALWEKTGQLLGVLDEGLSKSTADRIYDGVATVTNNKTTNMDESSESKSFTYAPVVYVYGNADQNDIQNALSVSREKFRDLMEEYENDNERKRF